MTRKDAWTIVRYAVPLIIAVGVMVWQLLEAK